MKRLRNAVCAVALLAVAAGSLTAQFDHVGSIDFPTSATGEAQQHFLRGVAFMHSFGWKQAREQFHQAQALDPDFALAYWGESLAYNHPLVSQMDPTDPRMALERLGASPEERAAKAPTDREKGLLAAVDVLWGDGEHVTRRVGYMKAMNRLHEEYPEDTEIAAFYALSMLGAVAATGDLSQRLNARAGAIAIDLFSRNPNHPGAPHYIIHSFDNPVMAPLALQAAYRFAEIADAVSHARHMPTHIFIQHGMWDLVSGHNQSAYDAARDLWQPGDAVGDAVHALDWGQYGDLQLGDYEKARVWGERLDGLATQGGFASGGSRGAAGVQRAINSVSLLKSRYIVETEAWEVQPITDDSPSHELLATALSAAGTGDMAMLREAEAALKTRAGDSKRYDFVMYKQAGALLHAGMGHADVATGLMDEAVEAIEAMAPPRGSANPVKPVHELYGEILLELDRPTDAMVAFEASLLRMPRRARSTLGLARAQARGGHHEAAAEAYRALIEIREGRDLPDVREAKEFLKAR